MLPAPMAHTGDTSCKQGAKTMQRNTAPTRQNCQREHSKEGHLVLMICNTRQRSCLLGLRLLVVVVIVIFIAALLLALALRGLLGILFFLLGLLDLAQGLPLLRKGVSLRHIVRDDDVVEDRAALDLPQVEAQETEVGILVQRIVVHILRIRDLLRLPEALVCGIRDALHMPLALVLGIVDHRCLPLAILLVIPIVWLLGLAVHDALLFDPICGLL